MLPETNKTTATPERQRGYETKPTEAVTIESSKKNYFKQMSKELN
jgi:hypothetical protein